MLPDEIGTYLAGAGLGLTLGVNLYVLPFPETSPDAAVCLVEFDGRTVGTFGASLSAAAVEEPSFKVIVRDGRDNGLQARQKADAVYKALRRLGPVTLSGVLYHNLKADLPQWLGYDENNRSRYHFDVQAWKAES